MLLTARVAITTVKHLLPWKYKVIVAKTVQTVCWVFHCNHALLYDINHATYCRLLKWLTLSQAMTLSREMA